MKLCSLFFLTIFLFSCKKNENLIVTDCQIMKNQAIKDYTNGNLVNVLTYDNNKQTSDYYIFKKYGLINYLQFYPHSTDTCYESKTKEFLKEKGVNFKDVLYDLDSLKKQHFKWSSQINKDSLSRELFSKDKFFDEILSEGISITRPEMIEPSVYNNIKIILTKEGFKKVNNSFWIVVDTLGNTENIEIYKKHNKIADSIVESHLQNLKWKPAKFKNNNIPVECRILFNGFF